ncbi:MAG: hypothetical protein COT81_05450 [Candidatus Buchananbacteria bacterium CG10_big_fil_rev_8_21_14_0_10_42_9]|uniref:Uncharacterized protein n=1 Tax=Candidatus Buchananbacteria bacterium CG10_big_fil_rev_8_21_14_0_10_42_9 TaxID=1974526 RepID=A0A2H0W1Y7_9BACT|nr:MAG: hypothetical protein COT81_05450 [Candidatus Buchananbacteria bacterium CG10_big_fil_rev_8_21_14_0_10_42_9]
MGIPLVIFYVAYLIAVAIFIIYSVFNIYHLVRFGYLNLANITIIFFYLFIAAGILIISWEYISQIDWAMQIPIGPAFTPEANGPTNFFK